MPKPTFIIIGPGRSGTTWIYEVLLEHPEVCMAAGTKETHFFNIYHHRGEEWYYKFFRNCKNSKAIGEISNLYFYDPEVPARIHDMLPNVHLIACLRDPLERMASAYLYRRRSGEVEGTFREALEKQPDLLTNNYYYTLLNNYLEYFSRDQLTLLFYQDLKKEPETFTRQIFKTIGVDQSFQPKNLYRTFNRSNQVRINFFAHLVHSGSDFLRKQQLYPVLNKLKRNTFLRKIIFKEIKRKNENIIPNDLKYQLIERLTDEIEGVEKLTGRDLKEWKRVK